MNLIPTVNTVPPWLQPRSSSTPMHSGVARGPVAMLMSANPDLTPEQAREILALRKAG